MDTKAGIIVALSGELATLTNLHLEKGEIAEIYHNVFVCLSGIGHSAALETGLKLIDYGADILISWGTAASLDENLKPGTIVIPSKIVTDYNSEIETDPVIRKIIINLLKNENIKTDCNLCSTNKLLTDFNQKIALGLQKKSIAADMESAAIAELCRKKNIPFGTVRSISDSPTISIPSTITKNMTVNGDINIFRLILSILVNPNEWIALIKLSRGFGKAKNLLKRTSNNIFPELTNKFDLMTGALTKN